MNIANSILHGMIKTFAEWYVMDDNQRYQKIKEILETGGRFADVLNINNLEHSNPDPEFPKCSYNHLDLPWEH